ncbi:MAG: glycosyltransferase family 4 protein [Candidatus Sulfotelmatobacter sp.]
MRIAQVAPLYESVPPRWYGGTERVVSWLTTELVNMGHDVTLFASGDSVTNAKLVPCCKRALRLDSSCVDPLAHHVLMIERVFSHAQDFDLIHFHTDYLHFPLSRRECIPSVTTLHGRLDLPDLPAIYQEFREIPVISISDSQRKPLPWANWIGTVHHGLPASALKLWDGSGDYLAFLGRISPEKGLDRAIQIATRAGIKLKVAAKIDKADREYFDSKIAALFKHPLVEFIGEIGDSEKEDFLGNAKALLFPIDWPEPFGLVMIEAMACGTPIIAHPCGSVPELIPDGVAGFLVHSLEQAVDAVNRIDEIDRAMCRRHFERYFTAERMAKDYLNLYKRIAVPESRRDDLEEGALNWMAADSPTPTTT